jgi:hypothetical protein
MPTYTPNFNLLKPVATELVDVNSQLNRNLDIIDKPLRGLFDYINTDVTSITAYELDRKPGYKYFKTYSNTLWFTGADNLVHQDNTVFVLAWGDLESYLINGWKSLPGETLRYRARGNTATNTVAYDISGSIILNNYDQIAANTTLTVMNLPSFMIPTRSCYYMQYGGDPGSLSCARVFIGSAGTMQVVKYGANAAAGNTQNKISLAGIRFFVSIPTV